MSNKRIETETAAELVAECRKAAGYPSNYAASLGAEVSSGTLHRIQFGQQDPSVGCLRGVLEKFGYRLRLVAEPMEK